MAGFTLGIGADTRDAVKAIDDVTTGLQANAEALDQIAKAGPDAGDAVTKGMEEAQAATAAAGKASQEAGEKITLAARNASAELGGLRPMALEDANAFDQLAQSAQKASTSTEMVGTAARKAGQDAEEGGQKIEEGGKLGEAAMMNVGFSAMQAGSLFTDGISGMTEQVGTFAAFMGPALAGVEGSLGALAWPVTIAGVALAALGGIMGSDSKEADTLTAAVKDYVSAALGAGDGSNALDAGIRKWAQSADDFGGVALTDLKKDLENTKVSFGEVASAIATQSLPKMEAQKKLVDQNIESLKTQAEVLRASNSGQGAQADALGRQADALGKVSGSLKQNIQQQELEKEVLKEVAAQQGLTVKQYLAQEKAADELASAESDMSDSIHSSLADAGSDMDDFTKNGVFDLAAYTKAVEKASQDAANYQKNLATAAADLTPEGLAYVESLGEAAAPALEAFAKAGPAQQAATANAWNKAGKDNGETYGKGVHAGLPKTIDGPTVTLNADDAKYQAVLKSIRDNPPPAVTVDVVANYRTGNRSF